MPDRLDKLYAWPHFIGVGVGLGFGAIASYLQDLVAGPLAQFAFLIYMGFGGIGGYLGSEAYQRPLRTEGDKVPFTEWSVQALATAVCLWGTIHFAGWQQVLAYFGNWLILFLIAATAAFIIAPYLWKHGGRLQVWKRPESRTLAIAIFAGGVVALWAYMGRPLLGLFENIISNQGPWWFWACLAVLLGTWSNHRYYRVRRGDLKQVED